MFAFLEWRKFFAQQRHPSKIAFLSSDLSLRHCLLAAVAGHNLSWFDDDRANCDDNGPWHTTFNSLTLGKSTMNLGKALAKASRFKSHGRRQQVLLMRCDFCHSLLFSKIFPSPFEVHHVRSKQQQ